jgi:hypothetical protein
MRLKAAIPVAFTPVVMSQQAAITAPKISELCQLL